MPPVTATHVVLVDEHDVEIGQAEKLSVHREGRLHRAVSVLAFDAAGLLIIQRRAAEKYHSGGLWSNSACTHPAPGESTAAAAERAVRTELGAAPTEMRYAFPMIYRADVGHGLVEHEYDHVFTCRVLDAVHPDVSEVAEIRGVSLGTIAREVAEAPERFTPWFRLLAERFAG